MNAWLDYLRDARASREPVMLVTVADVRGSAPREVGAKMLITAAETIGSIGGGQLEYRSARIAFELLQELPAAPRFTRRFPLGADLGQCCGGIVEILFERIVPAECAWLQELCDLYASRVPLVLATTRDNKYVISAAGVYASDEDRVDAAIVARARELLAEGGAAETRDVAESRAVLFEPVAGARMPIAVFGAGHVGSACVAVLSRLDCDLRWIDGRRDIFPRRLPPSVTAIAAADPCREIAAMPPGSYFLVMTHSHPLDYALCEQILRRDDAAYCGLIGSASKRRRFENLMRQSSLPSALVDRLVCPIGVVGIRGKRPEEIAIAVCAELLQVRDRAATKLRAAARRPVESR